MSRVINIGALSVEPGQKGSTELEIAQGFDGNPITMKLVVINGSSPGPKIFIDAGIHGNEVGGVEAANRIIATIDPKELNGALIITPCVNVTAFFNSTRKSPIDKKDLNRIFPGDPEGTFSETLASVFFQLISTAISSEDYRISLHGGGATTYIEVLEIQGDIGKKCMMLAKASGVGVIEIIERGGFWDNVYVGTIGMALQESGFNIPEITIESSDPFKAILNILMYFKMVKGKPKLLEKKRIWLREGRRVYATKRGLWIPKVAAGTFIKKNQQFAVITSINGEILENIKCPIDGYIISIRRKSIIDPLSGVFAIPGNYGGLIAKVVKIEENRIQ